MKINRKIITLAVLALTMCSPSLLNAWGHLGVVLHDPKTGHIVRLLGDRHAMYKSNGNEDKIEMEFKKNIQEALDEHLKLSAEKEIFIFEGVSQSMNYHKINAMLHKFYMIVGALGFVGLAYIYEMMSKKDVGTLNKIFFGLSAFFIFRMICTHLSNKFQTPSLFDDLTLHSYNRFDSRIREYDLRSALDPLLKRSLSGYALKISSGEQLMNALKNSDVIKSIKYARELPLKYDYDDLFSTIMKNFSTLFNDEKIENLASVEGVILFTNNLANSGLFSRIGRARKSNKNITLYTGSSHSTYMCEKLEEIGYKVLFFQCNEENTPLSKKDCEKLFFTRA